MSDFSFKQKIATTILKCTVIISAIIGVTISAKASSAAFMGGSRVFMYFTVQSNVVIAIVLLIELCLIMFKKNINYVWNVIKLVATVSITLTGTVFCFVLAPTMTSGAFSFSNVLTHVIVPVAAVIDFFFIGINCKYRRKDVLYVVIPPLLYAIFAGIGYAADWKFTNKLKYPYFFLNWGSKAGAFGFSSELPYIGVVWWIILILGLLIVVGNLYVSIINIIRNKKIWNKSG